MSISQVQLFSLPVTDQDRARDFYVDTLGFELIADTPMGPDQRWVQVRPPGSGTSITLVTWFPTMPAGSVKGTVLETSDLDGDVTALRSRGVVIDAGIQEAPWGRFVTFDDPDGNGLILQATAAAPPATRPAGELRPAMPGPDVFGAIASPVRRALLDELTGGVRSVHDLAAPFQMSRPAVSQHLRVLRAAGLVAEERVGRERHYRLDAQPLRAVADWAAQRAQAQRV